MNKCITFRVNPETLVNLYSRQGWGAAFIEPLTPLGFCFDMSREPMHTVGWEPWVMRLGQSIPRELHHMVTSCPLTGVQLTIKRYGTFKVEIRARSHAHDDSDLTRFMTFVKTGEATYANRHVEPDECPRGWESV